jgi:copper(I)-binding protein
MDKNNTRAFLAAALGLLLVRTVHADVTVVEARAELSTAEPRQVEVYFELRNDTTHDLELLKAVSGRAERVELKQRSVGADNKPRVWPVARFEVPPGGRLRLHADGRFFLVTGLEPGVAAGQILPITFTFEDERPVTLQLVLMAAPR